MQKGHLQFTVPILLLAIIALSLLATGSFARRTSDPAVGPLIPINGLSSITGDPADRPIIGRKLPTPPVVMQTKQAGTNADENLTPTALATVEQQPSASPGTSQNRIVFSSNGEDANSDGNIDGTPPTSTDFDLWIMRSDGSEQYRLADLPGDQVDPIYEPGGRLIVYSAERDGVWQIFTMEVRDPTNIRQITTGAGNKRHPTMSPDSLWICYQTDLNGTLDLYKVRSTGTGSPVQITSGDDDDSDPAWAPDGTVIAFTRDSAGIKRVYTTDPDGAVVNPLTNGGGEATVNDMQPAWRHNGAELAFASDRFISTEDTNADYNVWRVSSTGEVGGADATLVSNKSLTDTRNDVDPTWTVDIERVPTRVIFVSDRADSLGDIWSMQLGDSIPPILGELPTVTPRLAIPGNDVGISVPVSDRESGVAQVIAVIKDPDEKVYIWYDNQFFDSSYEQGMRAFEWDSEIVDAVPLDDADGDGVFTGTYTTPSATGGHDYIVDIMVMDTAGNSMLYDDIYGFSTRMFSTQNNILFVSDYCVGQSFLARLGWNNDIGAAFPVESYYTHNPGFYPGIEHTIDFDSIKDSWGDGYDTWRIICRGPVPATVYQYYLPTIEYQLDPKKLDGEGSVDVVADRKVAVADRAIIWAAPHTGNLWIADGSIMDAATQADLTNFINSGGRMLISGEDIAWALTLNGTRANSFLANTLRARFVADSAFTNMDVFVRGFLGRDWRMQRTAAEFGIVGSKTDPVTFDPWVGSGSHAADDLFDYWLDAEDSPTNINTPEIPPFPTTAWFTDAAWYSIRPDVIEPINAIKIYGAASGNNVADSGFEGPTIGLRYEDITRENGGRVVYLSFGFEQMHRGYHTPSNVPSHCRNLRSHLMHNAMCWERTGGFQGRVISVSDGGAPVNNPPPIVSAKIGGQVRYAVRCQSDGTWVMQGLPPGYYDLEASRPGFEIDKYDGEYTHGGQLPRSVDFAIKRAEPGAIVGTVVAAGSGAPLGNVTVSVGFDPDSEITPTDDLPDPVRTDVDGRYSISRVPPGQYVVTADGTEIGYGTEDQTVTVPIGDSVTADFALGAADGVIVAYVTDVDTSDPVRNASVTASGDGGSETEYTDANGEARLSVQPGDYEVRASAPGYQSSASQPVSVSPATESSVDIALKQEPGGRIVGRVTAAASGSFVGDATVTVYFGDEEIAAATTAGSAVETIGGVQYNYAIEDVPTGDVRVEVTRAGFSATPTERYVTVVTEATTRDVNFSMRSLRTFPAGLQLVSFPWDYSSTDPAALLGISPSSFRMATWQASRARYRIYPDAPADRFRVGTGYWMNLSSPADLSIQGQDATDPVEIPLAAGWNLIGDPYNSSLDFYAVKVRQGAEEMTVQKAMSRGVLGSGLYAYVLGGYQSTAVLSPFSGYWLKALQPCTLKISRSSGTLAAGAEKDALPRPEDGWLLQLTTSVGEVRDSATFIGTAASATDGCDFNLDQAKPPVPAMGAYVYTAIDNRDWAQMGADYAVDVRPAGQKAVWNLKVYTNAVGKNVTMSWGDMSNLPQDARPVLTDVRTGKRVYMRTASNYSFASDDQPRALKVELSADSVGQLAVTPQAAVTTAQGASISYTLSKAASVDIVVTNIAGRVVRQVLSGAMQTAGQNTVIWDGRDRSGLPVPAGRYLISIVGRTDSGQEARTVVPLHRGR